MQVSFSGATASCINTAAREYFATLTEDTEQARDYDQIFYAGRWSYGVTWIDGSHPRITLESAEEDVISSLEIASEDLAQAITGKCPDASLTYEEQPLS